MKRRWQLRRYNFCSRRNHKVSAFSHCCWMATLRGCSLVYSIIMPIILQFPATANHEPRIFDKHNWDANVSLIHCIECDDACYTATTYSISIDDTITALVLSVPLRRPSCSNLSLFSRKFTDVLDKMKCIDHDSTPNHSFWDREKPVRTRDNEREFWVTGWKSKVCVAGTKWSLLIINLDMSTIWGGILEIVSVRWVFSNSC